jgi:hypothetical protein
VRRLLERLALAQARSVIAARRRELERDAGRYLFGLVDYKGRARDLLEHGVEAQAAIDWLEGTAYEVVVEHGCLSMRCTSPTIERATQFAGIFEAVEADIIRLLGWC